jgi:glycosyltransferase involved in cell wall biosynthesis
MHILFCVPRYWPSIGGAQAHSRELVRRLSARHSVKVVTQYTSDRDSFLWSAVHTRPGGYNDGAIPVERLGPEGAWRPILHTLSRGYERWRLSRPALAWLLDRSLRPQLDALIRAFRPDLVHGVHIGLVYSSEMAAAAAHRARVPFVWTPFPHLAGGGWDGPRFRRLYREADALIAMTEYERGWLIGRGSAPSRTHVIPGGPLVERAGTPGAFRKKYGLGNAPVVFFLGQKLPYKGYRQLVEAAPLVWQQIPDARFVVAGPRTAESETFFESVTDGRILELAAIDAADKSAALADSTVFCLPSVEESLGLVYLEAWHFRKAVIAADIPVSREVISAGQDGLLVEQSAPEIASAIIRLLSDPGLCERLGEAGSRKEKLTYSWEQTIVQMEETYLSLTPGH